MVSFSKHVKLMASAYLLLIILGVSPLSIASAEPSNGLVSIESHHNVATTADKLVEILTEKEMRIFARIDHAAGAQKVGQTLRPTELVIFGHPKSGTPLMLCAQTAGIDLPLKALVWEDENGKTWITYNDPKFLNERHGLADCAAVLEKMATALAAFAGFATQ